MVSWDGYFFHKHAVHGCVWGEILEKISAASVCVCVCIHMCKFSPSKSLVFLEHRPPKSARIRQPPGWAPTRCCLQPEPSLKSQSRAAWTFKDRGSLLGTKLRTLRFRMCVKRPQRFPYQENRTGSVDLERIKKKVKWVALHLIDSKQIHQISLEISLFLKMTWERMSLLINFFSSNSAVNAGIRAVQRFC